MLNKWNFIDKYIEDELLHDTTLSSNKLSKIIKNKHWDKLQNEIRTWESIPNNIVDALRKYIYRYLLKRNNNQPTTITHKNKPNVIIIGDLHLPFVKKHYLQFILDTMSKYGLDITNTHIVFIGDIIDNHFSSFHTTSTRAYSADDELRYAQQLMKDWVIAFPQATVTIGNHDRIIQRKAFEGGISSHWIRGYNEVFNTRNWDWCRSKVINDLYVCHGEGSTARTTALRMKYSVAQGHRHFDCYIHYHNADRFGMQVPMGVDKDSYALEYSQDVTKELLNGVALYIDKTPIIEIM